MDALLKTLRIRCQRCKCMVPLNWISLAYWNGFWNIACASGYCHKDAFHIPFTEVLENGDAYMSKLEHMREYKMSLNTFEKRRTQLFDMVREAIAHMNDPIP